MTRQSLLQRALELPENERSLLADELWQSLGHELESPITPEQSADLDQRLAEDDAGASKPEEWSSFRATLEDDK